MSLENRSMDVKLLSEEEMMSLQWKPLAEGSDGDGETFTFDGQRLIGEREKFIDCDRMKSSDVRWRKMEAGKSVGD